MISRKGLSKTELVSLILFGFLCVATAPAMTRFVGDVFYKEDSEDTDTISAFNNLVDEVNTILEDDNLYAKKEILPMYIGGEHAIAAFNKDESEIDIVYVNAWDEEDIGQIGDSKLIPDWKRTLQRPPGCEDSCLCLLKRIPNDNSGWTASADWDMPADKRYQITEPVKCEEFPENVRFYGSNIIYTAYYSPSSNPDAGLTDERLDSENLMFNYNFGRQHKELEFDPLNDLEFWDEQNLPAQIHINWAHRIIYFYSYIFMTSHFPTRVNDDFIRNLVGGYWHSLTELYLDKVDYTKLGEDHAPDNAYVHVFIGNTRLPDIINNRHEILKTLESKDPDRYRMQILGSSSDSNKFKSFLEYARWAVNPLIFDKFEAKQNIGDLGEEAINKVRQAVLNRKEECYYEYSDPRARAECMMRYVGDCDGYGSQTYDPQAYDDDYNDCLRFLKIDDSVANYYNAIYEDYFDGISENLKYAMGEDQADEVFSRVEYYAGEFEKPCQLFMPEIVLQVLNKAAVELSHEFEGKLLEAQLKEEAKLYFEAYNLYLDFVEDNRDQFYDENGINIYEIDTAYNGKLSTLKEALKLKYYFEDKGLKVYRKKTDEDHGNMYYFDFKEIDYRLQDMIFLYKTRQFGYITDVDLSDIDANYIDNDPILAKKSLSDLEQEKTYLYFAMQVLFSLESFECITVNRAKEIFYTTETVDSCNAILISEDQGDGSDGQGDDDGDQGDDNRDQGDGDGDPGNDGEGGDESS